MLEEHQLKTATTSGELHPVTSYSNPSVLRQFKAKEALLSSLKIDKGVQKEESHEEPLDPFFIRDRDRKDYWERSRTIDQHIYKK
jgi:hypothetical protein